MKSNNKLIASTLALSLFLAFPAVNAHAFIAANDMKDLSSNHWAYKAIESLVEKYGVMSGYPDKTFKGSKNMTRYELAATLYKVMTKVEELIAKANKSGTSDTNDSGVSQYDLQTLMMLQKEFKGELTSLKAKVDKLSDRMDKINRLSITGNVEIRYRDRLAVTDFTSNNSPLQNINTDDDKGTFNFNDSIRNLITEYDRTPFRVRTTLDLKASLTPGIRYYGTFLIDDGTVFKLSNTPGQSIGGHFGNEGLSGSPFFAQKSFISIRNNFQDDVYKPDEYFKAIEKETAESKMPGDAGTSFYHESKPGFGLTAGLMNFQNIVRTGTKFRNHFSSERWIGHGYGLVGFGSDDILVKSKEIKNAKGETEVFRNSVSRFWATGINVSRVDPDSQRYNNVPSPSLALDATMGPLSIVVAGNAGSPYVNRVLALNSNLGAGVPAIKDEAYKAPVTATTPAPVASTTTTPVAAPVVPPAPATGGAVTAPAPATGGNGFLFGTKASETGILSGLDFAADTGGSLVNNKVVIGSKDILFGRTTQNLLDLPSEYGDGYGLINVDLDLGWLRFGLAANDYWLDSLFSLSGTRKSVSGVIDIGSNNFGITLQGNYFGIGLDTYSAALVMNDLPGGLDFGLGLKTASRGMFNFNQLTGTNAGFYLVLPQKYKSPVPRIMVAARQSFGDNFGSPKNLSGTELLKVSTYKDSGVTLGVSFGNLSGSGINLDLEYNALVEGALWGFNVMAHDVAVFTSYNF